MPTRSLILLLAFLFLSLPTSRSQPAAGVGVAYHDLEEVGRWGVNGAFFIPVANHSFDIVPNFEYYYSKWTVNSMAEARDVYVIAVDAHANVPDILSRLRTYFGTGVVYAGHGDEGGFGVNLSAGLYVRPVGWRVFPFGHVSYRLLADFEEIESLDAYFLRGGLRITL
ncbi:MAG: hypothetical protein R3284_01295 [Rubricoccaceae bacterium]|nr:hypothetical protein [Rubricoccaceae bacterium]